MDSDIPPQTDRATIEVRKLQTIFNELPYEAQEVIGPLQIEHVGDAGFIVQRTNHVPMAGNDWVLYDYDDTIAATTEAKNPRLTEFVAYAQVQYPDLDAETCEKLMKASDKFSRWEEQENSGRNYHIHTHVSVLDWALHRAGEIIAAGTPADEVVADIQSTLDRIQAGEVRDDDPFYMRLEDRKFVTKGIAPRNTELEDIFSRTFAHPRLYDEVLESMRSLAGGPDSIHRTNVGIITYGEPHYQLRKLFTMLQDNPDLPISQILLTSVGKGDFIKRAIASSVEKKFPAEYVPASLDDDEGFGSLGSGGQLFSDAHHSVIIFDDDPTQLENITSAAKEIKGSTGAHIITVRSIRPGTKAEHRPGQSLVSEYGTIDFRNRTGTDLSISDILLVNKYLAVKKGIEDDDIAPTYEYVRTLREELSRRNIELT